MGTESPLRNLLFQLGKVDVKSLEALLDFAGLIAWWNRVYRLVGSVDPSELFDKHLYDAIVLRDNLEGAGRLVDIGAGAGLPSIPLSILRRDIDVVLVEPQLKRVNFCEQVRRELTLTNLRVIRGRAEDDEVTSQVGICRWVLSRATWKLNEYLEIARLYGGETTVLALKGEGWRDELGNAAAPVKVIPYETPISRTRRTLLVFRNQLSREKLTRER